jgi:hypothetical protein
MIAIGLFFIGMHRYWLLIPMLSVGAFIFYINKKAVKTNLDPLIDKISRDIETLESENK